MPVILSSADIREEHDRRQAARIRQRQHRDNAPRDDVTLVRAVSSASRAADPGYGRVRNTRQDRSFAFIDNNVGMDVAAPVLQAASDLLLIPTIAARAMSLSSVSLISDARHLCPAMLQ